MRYIAIILPLALLSACGEPRERIRTVEVATPYDDPECARAALQRLGAPPAYPDIDGALQQAENIFDRVKLLLAGRELRQDREQALTDAIKACAQ